MFDVRQALESLGSFVLGAAAWVLAAAAIAAAVFWTPRLARHVIRGESTRAERWAALVVLVGVLAGGAILATPFSDGPYRCSPVLAGAEGRQTVRPNDTPRDNRQATTEILQAELARRDHVCDDAAKARAVTAAVLSASALIISAGVAYIFRPSLTERRRPQADETPVGH